MTQSTEHSLRGMPMADLLKLPAVIDIETAGKALGIGRTTAYQLAKKDKFPCTVIRAGRTYRVPTAALLAILQVTPTTQESTAA